MKIEPPYAQHNVYIYGGKSFVHTHIVNNKIKGVKNEWKKVGNRFLAVCSFCGCRAELR